MDLQVMQRIMLDGFRLNATAALDTLGILQEQAQRSWSVALEQGERMRGGMEKAFSEWLKAMRKSQEEVHLNMEEGLRRMEDIVSGNGGSWMEAWTRWPIGSQDIYRRLVGMWAPPQGPGEAPESAKEGRDAAQAGKGK